MSLGPPRACTTCVLWLAMTLAGCVECPRLSGLDASQCAALAQMRLPSTIPPSPGNRVADDENAAILGHALFFDARLSRDQAVRCATCHEPERFFTDGRPVSRGLAEVTRNSPSLLASPWHRWQMQDGRADSLWSQPLIAFENEREMDFTRVELAHGVLAFHQARYEALFGALPPLADTARFPPRAKPGDAAWAAMSAADRHAINTVAANVGKAIEAYERKLYFRPGKFDRFLDGEAGALTPVEQRGLVVYFEAGCASCHSGPIFSDDDFHDVGFPTRDGAPAELGRAEGLEFLLASEFNAAGAFHDAEPQVLPPAFPSDRFAWRTPSLRNVARTYPYGHNGVFSSLEAVLDAHASNVTGADRDALLALLAALNASDPPSPWNTWPNR